MKKNPQIYGLLYKEAANDPQLAKFREVLAVKAAEALDKAHMIRFDPNTQYLHSTDLGRIASQFYIKYDTVEVFNEFLRQVMNESDILGVISQSSEFKQLKVRDEEMTELDELYRNCEVAPLGGVENVHGKVNVLLQAYISRVRVEGFSLVSDMNYVTEVRRKKNCLCYIYVSYISISILLTVRQLTISWVIFLSFTFSKGDGRNKQTT